jgi:hypothetical protein
VARNPERASLISCGDEADEKLRADVVKRRKAEFIDHDQVRAQQTLYDPADAVIGETAIQQLNQRCRSEVAHPATSPDGRLAQVDEGVALADAGRSDENQVLASIDPFQRRQVVEGRLRDRGLGHFQLIETLGDREAGLASTVCLIRLIAGRDLGVDQCAQHSSGAQRWTLAVWSTSGASERLAQGFRRRSPSSRSSTSSGASAAVIGPVPAHRLRGVAPAPPPAGQADIGHGGVGLIDRRPATGRDHKIALGIAHEVLHHTLGVGIGGSQKSG